MLPDQLVSHCVLCRNIFQGRYCHDQRAQDQERPLQHLHPCRQGHLRKSPTGRSLCDMRPCQQPPGPEAPWTASKSPTSSRERPLGSSSETMRRPTDSPKGKPLSSAPTRQPSGGKREILNHRLCSQRLPKAKLLRIPQDLIPGRSTSKARRESAKGTRVNPNGTSKAPETTQAESPTHSRRDRTPSGERHNPERRLRSLTHKGVRSCLLHDGEASQRGGRKRKRGPRSAPSQSRKTKQGKEEGSHPHQVSPEGPTGQIREGGGERGISSRNQAQPGLYAGR
jgi:hypothetical protein